MNSMTSTINWVWWQGARIRRERLEKICADGRGLHRYKQALAIASADPKVAGTYIFRTEEQARSWMREHDYSFVEVTDKLSTGEIKISNDMPPDATHLDASGQWWAYLSPRAHLRVALRNLERRRDRLHAELDKARTSELVLQLVTQSLDAEQPLVISTRRALSDGVTLLFNYRYNTLAHHVVDMAPTRKDMHRVTGFGSDVFLVHCRCIKTYHSGGQTEETGWRYVIVSGRVVEVKTQAEALRILAPALGY